MEKYTRPLKKRQNVPVSEKTSWNGEEALETFGAALSLD